MLCFYMLVAITCAQCRRLIDLCNDV
eukprot:COSAG01_NODE_56735_length_316_cov_1.188940_1_plen_25_part_10